MSELGQHLDAVIRAGLAPELKAEGFKKSGRTFRLEAPRVIRVVSVQGSASNTDSAGKFTLNLGVYFPGLRTLLEPELPAKPPGDVDCPFRMRIGEVMPQCQDHWWPLDLHTDVAALGAEVRQAYVVFARPWLEAKSDLACARAAFAAQERTLAEAAAASLLLGEREEARRLHAAALARGGWVGKHAQWWGTRLGLP